MPRIPQYRAGSRIVQPGAGPRVGQPGPGASEGFAQIGRALGDMAEQESRIDQGRRDLAAERTIDMNRQAAADERAQMAADAEARKRQEAADKLAAGNAAIEYELQTDAVMRAHDADLAAGKIDPDGYRNKVAADLRKATQALAKDLPETARPMFEQALVRPSAKTELAIRDRLQKHDEDRRLGLLEQNTEQLGRLAVGDLPRALSAASALFSEDGPYAQIKGAEAAAKAGAQFRERATLGHFRAKVAGAADDRGSLADLRKAVAGNGDLDPMQQSAMLSSIDSRVQVLDNRAQAAVDRRERAAASAASALQALSDGGFPISPDYAAQVVAATKGTSHAAGVREVLKGAAETAGFGSKPVAEQDAIVQGMVAKAATQGVSPTEAKRLDKLMKIRDASAREYAANPWRAAADRGQIEMIPPINTQSLEGMAESLAERMAVLPVIEQAAGAPVSPLQPDEADAVQRMLGTLAAPDRAAMLGRIGQTIGESRMMALAGQLAKGDPTMGVVAAAEARDIRTDAGESVSALILKGQEAIEGKRVKVDDMAGEGIQAQMREYLGDAIVSPAARDAAVSAAVKVWAAKAADGDDLDYEEALQAVTGKVIEHAGRKTLAPTGWTVDEMERAVEALTPDRIAQAAGGPIYSDGVEVPAETLAEQIDAVQLQQQAGNRYMLSIAGVPLTDANRRPVFVTLDKPGPAPGLWERMFGG